MTNIGHPRRIRGGGNSCSECDQGCSMLHLEHKVRCNGNPRRYPFIGTLPQDGGADGMVICPTITSHYHKEGWTNFIPGTNSKIKAIAILIEYD